MNWVTHIDQHRRKTLGELAQFVSALPRTRVGDLTLEEICTVPGDPHGLYFLFDRDGPLWYVGMASSRTFGTRLSANFDQLEDAMLNSVPKKIRRVCQTDSYAQALKIGLDLHLCVLGIPRSVGPNRLENALRSVMKPHLNTERRQHSPTSTVEEYL